MKPLYLQSAFGLGFDKPAAAVAVADVYVSDPAKPVPYLPRPVRFLDHDQWKQWLVIDQKSVADRTDVLAYQTSVLTAPVRVSGAPIADLFAVPNIFFAQPADYVKATQSIFRSADRASAVWLPLVE